MEAIAYVALGSNQGDRELYLLRAVAELGKLPGCRVTAVSHFYETSPVGPVPQENFYNAVVRLATVLDPHGLLTALQHLEDAVFGRVRTIPQGPRPVDLDLLLYDDCVLQTPTLTIPHPRLTERRFVLQPLADIAADLRPPGEQRTVRQLLAALPAGETVVPLAAHGGSP